MIITLASSKGGVGKSTITGCLAGVWAADGDGYVAMTGRIGVA